ncbi:MAG TPA: ATP-binding cassette domain-containing protein, partial [Armatimonadota bacterium]
VATEVVDLTGGVAAAYKGNYSQYVAQKELAEAQLQEAYERQQQEIAKLEAYVRRYKAGNRATMAKSRENRLQRMDRIDRPRNQATTHFRIAPASRSGRYVVAMHRAAKRYDSLRLFSGLELVVQRGERLGLVGPNGSGKSTLIKCIIGEEELNEGEVVIGHGVTLGTFGQQHEHLDEENSVLDELLNAGDVLPAQARNLLAQFLFRGDDVFKPVSALSGGERNRLILCKLMVSAPNLLVLDEPTNHLDLWSRQALERALSDYAGTLIFASHDRYLLSALANRIVHVKDGQATPFDYTYDEWRAYTAPVPPAATNKSKRAAPSAPKPGKPRSVNVKRELAKVENEIGRVEARLAELTALLGDEATYADGTSAAELSQEYQELNTRLQALNTDWELLAEQALVA